MTYFFVDDAFADSREVMSIPARYRNAAVGLWTRCGAWSAGKLTDGEVPMSVVESFAGKQAAKLVAVLVAATLWDSETDLIRFRNWSKWQRNRNQVVAYREAQKEKKRKQREAAASKNAELSPGDKQGDTKSCPPGTPQTPIPVPIPKYLSGHQSTQETQVEPDHARGLTEPVNPSASRLVAALIPDTIPATVRTGLRIRASQLMNRDGLSADDTAETLRRWLTRTDAGVGLLDSLAADVIRERATPAQPHKMRATADLAARMRAEENQAAAEARKELER